MHQMKNESSIKNKRNSKLPGFLAAAVLGLAVFSLSLPAQASTKSSLLNKIQKTVGSSVLRSWYADFDGNGSKEVFAVMGYGETENSLWFASDKEVKILPAGGFWYYADYHNPAGICKVSEKQKLFVMESGAGGSGSTSHCYYVKSGRVKTVAKAGEGLMQISGKQFAVHMSAFDSIENDGHGEGHTYKRYYLKWTGTKFKEYKGTQISQKTLKKYTGASALLKKAKNEGYSIGTIFRRGNGIINVNLYKKEMYGGRVNENLTLKISGKKVKLVTAYANAANWIQKYSYRGVYKSSGF